MAALVDTQGRGIRAFRDALLLALTLGAAGCATFSSKTPPMVRQLPPRVAAKPSVRVTLSYSRGPILGRDVKPNPKRTRRLEEEMETAFRQSGYFSRVGPDTPDADLVIDAQLGESTDADSDYGMLLLRTFGLYPESYRERYSLRVTATSPRLQTARDLRLESGFRTWGDLLLLPLMPFTYETAVAHRVRSNLFRSVCLQLEQQGILDAATKGEAKAANH